MDQRPDRQETPGFDAHGLEGLFAEFQAEAGRPVDGSRVADWAAAAATETARASRPGRRGKRVSLPLAAWKRRTATALASLVLLAGGMSGLAWAANGSVPGNALYGLDRALEHVGIGNGGADERLREVRALIETGEIPAGLSHAGELVGDQAGDSPAAEALEEAAGRVAEAGSEVSADVHDHVAALLGYLAENVGRVNGQEVAVLARRIGGNDGSPENGPPDEVPPADQPGPPDGVPVGPPDDVPPGPPENVPPDHPGGPPVSVPPVVVGPPVEAGPPISLPLERP